MNTESFAEAFQCTESPREFPKAEYEWQRTEGKLNEIGLNVNTGGQLKDGLIKSPGFTDEDKLCFFDAKIDKITVKDKESDMQNILYQSKQDHLESLPFVSDAFPQPVSISKASEVHGDKAGSQKMLDGLHQTEAITDHEKAAHKTSLELTAEQRQMILNIEGKLETWASNHEASALKANLNSVLPNYTTDAKDYSLGGCISGVADTHRAQNESSSSKPSSKAEPPTTKVEFAQEDVKPEQAGNTSDLDEDGFLIDRDDELGSQVDCPLLNRSSYQRKAMRRAMSECSHLAVPVTVDIADKYPEIRDGKQNHSPVLTPPLTSNSAGMPKKHTNTMKRSMTVAEQTADYDYNGHSLVPTSLVKEQLRAASEEEGQSLLAPELHITRLDNITEALHSHINKEEDEHKNPPNNPADLLIGAEGKEKNTEHRSTDVLGEKEMEESKVVSLQSSQQVVITLSDN